MRVKNIDGYLRLGMKIHSKRQKTKLCYPKGSSQSENGNRCIESRIREDMTNQNKETLFKDLIERTLAKMSPEFDAWVRKKIVFVFPKEKALAKTINKKESKHYEAVIVLFDELLSQEEWYQEHCLLHEIAHVKLKHTKQKDAKKEANQENEAHALALKWLTETIHRNPESAITEQKANWRFKNE